MLAYNIESLHNRCEGMKQKSIILVSLAIAVLLSSCQLPSLFKWTKPAANMRITAFSEVSIADASIMDRSPDGRWLIVYTYPDPPYSEFCIYKSKDLSPVFCMPEEDDIGITLQPVAWSPDSKKLALVERLPNVPIDTDIWILNLETAHLEDITEDGISGILSVEMEVVPYLDNAPAWSPDGIWIAFARTSFTNDTHSYETALYKIPALGGDAEKVAVVSDEPVAIPNGMLAWLADGRLIYTPMGKRPDGGILGLSAVPVSGDQPAQTIEGLREDVSRSSLISVSPDSRYALLLHEIMDDLGNEYALIQLYNLQTGESTPLKSPSPNTTAWFARSNWAAFAPDSSKVAYVYESPTPTAQWRLALVDIGSEEEVVLKTFDAREYYINYPLRWGEDDVLMLRLVQEEPPFPIQLLTVK
jgi:hypothetical protein